MKVHKAALLEKGLFCEDCDSFAQHSFHSLRESGSPFSTRLIGEAAR